MKTASVRELRNNYTSVLRWVSAGEEVVITQRGKAIARLVPEQADSAPVVDWAASPAVQRDRTNERMLSAEESLQLIHDASGKW